MSDFKDLNCAICGKSIGRSSHPYVGNHVAICFDCYMGKKIIVEHKEDDKNPASELLVVHPRFEKLT